MELRCYSLADSLPFLILLEGDEYVAPVGAKKTTPEKHDIPAESKSEKTCEESVKEDPQILAEVCFFKRFFFGPAFCIDYLQPERLEAVSNASSPSRTTEDKRGKHEDPPPIFLDPIPQWSDLISTLTR